MSQSTVGQIERRTQSRVAALFRDRVGYDYLGNWDEREGFAGQGNRNTAMPQWRLRRAKLNQIPLSHDSWKYRF